MNTSNNILEARMYFQIFLMESGGENTNLCKVENGYNSDGVGLEYVSKVG